MRTRPAMTSAALVAAFAISFVGAPSAGAAQGSTVRVTSAADSGPGTLRAALGSGAGHVVIDPSVDVIDLDSPLTGTTSVRIQGAEAVIDATGIGLGLAFTAPATASGVFEVEVRNLTVIGAGDHGIYVTDDQDVGDLDAAGSGSPASVTLTVHNVTVDNVGYGASDRDGIRVDERDDGTLTFVAKASRFTRAGADGVELDETAAGDIVFDVDSSTFEANGPLDPEDLDDGFDVDEVDDGNVIGSIRSSSFLANYDEGIDINEDGQGSIDVDLVSVTVRDTDDGDGIAFEEHGDGDVTVDLRASTSTANPGDGFEIAEEGVGDVVARIISSTLTGNDKGIDIEELDAGNAYVTVHSTTIADGAGDGFEVAEDGDGIIAAVLTGSTITGNDKGLDLDADGDGTGSTLKRRGTTVTSNAEDVDLDDVTEI